MVVTSGPAAVSGAFMRRPFASLFRIVFALALLVPVSLLATSPVAAATTIAPTTTCGVGLGDLGGRGLICEVTVVNTITASGGTATVTVRECLGSAGAPTDGSGGAGFACTTKTATLTQPVTAVTQCNNSTNGGGGTLQCSVKITNNFVGISPGETTATVNQCIGSGASGTVGLNIKCNPTGAATGAAVTQCNGSANGGTLVGLTCTATGTKPSSHGVKINQCNGSANGGGALVICSASITNKAVASGSSPTATAGATAAPTVPPTSTTDQITAQESGTSPLVLVGLLCLVALSVIAASRRRGDRREAR